MPVFPISFSIPEEHVLDKIPEKKRDFSRIMPQTSNQKYTFTKEKDYYKEYQDSYYGLTFCKGGWDCMRHYEILANGCIPWFEDLSRCPETALPFFPKNIIHKGMDIAGCKKSGIFKDDGTFFFLDHSASFENSYQDIAMALLNYTKESLTTKAMAKYVLNKINLETDISILYLNSHPYPDYLRDLTFHGFRSLLGEQIVDAFKIPYLYQNFPEDQTIKLHGRGFSYSRLLEDIPINRENIEEKIKQHEFNIIVYGNYHRTLPHWNIVNEKYDKEDIILMCGEDRIEMGIKHSCPLLKMDYNCFIREL